MAKNLDILISPSDFERACELIKSDSENFKLDFQDLNLAVFTESYLNTQVLLHRSDKPFDKLRNMLVDNAHFF